MAASQLEETRRDPDSQEGSPPPPQGSKTLSLSKKVRIKPNTQFKKPGGDKRKEAAAKAAEKYQADLARQQIQASAATSAKTKLDLIQAEHEQIVKEAEKALEEAEQQTEEDAQLF